MLTFQIDSTDKIKSFFRYFKNHNLKLKDPRKLYLIKFKLMRKKDQK